MRHRSPRVAGMILDPDIPRYEGGRAPSVALCHMCQRSVYFAGGFLRLLATTLHRQIVKEFHLRAKAFPNDLPADLRIEIRRLAVEEHLGVRGVCRRTGLAKGTVQRHFPIDVRCPCGKLLIEHRGWCSHRYAQSPARQKVMTAIHDRQRFI